jgi:DNA-binding transcriptional regulator YdaS (Cro superfamily)
MDSSVAAPPNDEIRTLLKRAVRIVGSQERLARKCRCSQQNISRAIVTGKVTIKLAMAIERAVNGEIAWQDLVNYLPWDDDVV